MEYDDRSLIKRIKDYTIENAEILLFIGVPLGVGYASSEIESIFLGYSVSQSSTIYFGMRGLTSLRNDPIGQYQSKNRKSIVDFISSASIPFVLSNVMYWTQ